MGFDPRRALLGKVVDIVSSCFVPGVCAGPWDRGAAASGADRVQPSPPTHRGRRDAQCCCGGLVWHLGTMTNQEKGEN